MKHLFIIIACVLLISCEKTKDYYIKVENNSNRVICFHTDLDYPDDSILFRRCRSDYLPVSILPYSSHSYITGVNGKVHSWYVDFEQAELYHSGYVSLYISEMDSPLLESIEQKNTTEGFVDFPVIARYDLNRENIEALDWIVTYPPSEEMKGIHMWLKPETTTE